MNTDHHLFKELPNFGIHISMGGEMGPNEDSSGGDIDKGDEGMRKDEKGCHQNHWRSILGLVGCCICLGALSNCIITYKEFPLLLQQQASITLHLPLLLYKFTHSAN